MVERKIYEQTEDYKKSLELIADFVKEVLEGDIDRLKDYCLEELEKSPNLCKKYVGNIMDPDMYKITQAIYIVLWGHVWELSFSNMGSWCSNKKESAPFRGDTMNSFNSLIGRDAGFGFRTKFFGIEKDEVLWGKIIGYDKIYHRIGNCIVIPNGGKVKNGINGARGNFLFGMRDYFDWFLISLYNYQQRLLQHSENIITDFDDAFSSKVSFENYLKENDEYLPEYLRVEEWKDIFWLDDYFKNGIPSSLFRTKPSDRTKKTAAPENRKGKRYFEDEEYKLLLEDYIDKSMMVIEHRGTKMIEVLKRVLETGK